MLNRLLTLVVMTLAAVGLGFAPTPGVHGSLGVQAAHAQEADPDAALDDTAVGGPIDETGGPDPNTGTNPGAGAIEDSDAGEEPHVGQGVEVGEKIAEPTPGATTDDSGANPDHAERAVVDVPPEAVAVDTPPSLPESDLAAVVPPQGPPEPAITPGGQS